MTVKISIEVGPCKPAIPDRATVRIEYADGQQREIIWTYDGRSSPKRDWSVDHYSRETLRYDDAGTSTMVTTDLTRLHPRDPMKVADAGPLIREIAKHLGSVLPTVLAVDQAAR